MKLCEVMELPLYDMYKNVDWGKKKKITVKQVTVRSTRTGKVYGRRKIATK